jgi:hypothetical protein
MNNTSTFTSSEIKRLLKAPKLPFIKPSQHPPKLSLNLPFNSKLELNRTSTTKQHTKHTHHKEKISSDKHLVPTRACSEDFEDDFIHDKSLSILESLQLNQTQV